MRGTVLMWTFNLVEKWMIEMWFGTSAALMFPCVSLGLLYINKWPNSSDQKEPYMFIKSWSEYEESLCRLAWWCVVLTWVMNNLFNQVTNEAKERLISQKSGWIKVSGDCINRFSVVLVTWESSNGLFHSETQMVPQTQLTVS